MYGDGKGNFKPAAITETGFIADNDSKALGRVSMANNTTLFLVTQNSDSLKIFRDNKTGKRKNTQNKFFAKRIKNSPQFCFYLKGKQVSRIPSTFVCIYKQKSYRELQTQLAHFLYGICWQELFTKTFL